MNLSQAKEQFICEWGTLSSNWGVNKTMGQIHALLLVSDKELCADEIMTELKVSQGNVNMNLRALLDWGLVDRIHKTGHRRDFYKAEKDIGKILKLIIHQRKKKELDPLINLLNEISAVEPRCQESNEFCHIIKELRAYSKKADQALETITSSNGNWISRIFLR